MISDRETWQTAGVMIKRHGDDAPTEAAGRTDELLAKNDREGYAVWRRFVPAVNVLSVRPGTL